MLFKPLLDLPVHIEEEFDHVLIITLGWSVITHDGVHDRPAVFVCFMDDEGFPVNNVLDISNV